MAKKWFEIFANMLFWLLTIWLISNSYVFEVKEIENINGVERVIETSNGIDIIKLLLIIGLSLILFYSNFQNTLKLTRSKNRGSVIINSILLLLSTFIIHYIIQWFLFSSEEPVALPIFSWGVFIFYFTISIAYGLSKVWEKTEEQKRQLIFEKQQAELSLLRSQLHPHFLFNVLNNLLAMVDQKKNPALANSLDQLSGLLRYVVYDTAKDKVPVQKEINFITNFAELQSLRFEQNEIDFDLNIIGAYNQQKIEPGIFVPFIENAFKYGAAPEHQSQIKVSFDLSESDKITFSISNPVLLNQTGNGSGISSTKERLKLVYPGKHKINITKGAIFNVQIEINTDESHHS